MQGKFNQYNLRTILAKKHSHVTYLASPTNEPECQVVLTVFASSLFRIPHEQEKLLLKARHIKELQHPHLVPKHGTDSPNQTIFGSSHHQSSSASH
ncbi:MAG TPA: hypothetical protein VGL94_17815 [Ktedonobacteraceae bacterium]|jgi:hypothetical protein